MIRHKMYGTRIYRSYYSMKQRCDNPNHKHYRHYGGRGITYCDEWKEFTNFYHDMGDMPDGMTLDRIDNDSNYEPSNCRWATVEEQVSNKRMQKNNTSGVIGVSYNKLQDDWEVRFKSKYIGRRKDFEEACNLRKLAEEKGIV